VSSTALMQLQALGLRHWFRCCYAGESVDRQWTTKQFTATGRLAIRRRRIYSTGNMAIGDDVGGDHQLHGLATASDLAPVRISATVGAISGSTVLTVTAPSGAILGISSRFRQFQCGSAECELQRPNLQHRRSNRADGGDVYGNGHAAYGVELRFGTGNFWTCGAVAQVVTCTNSFVIPAGSNGQTLTLDGKRRQQRAG